MTPNSNSQQAAAGAPHDETPAGDDRMWLSALADGDAQALPWACSLWRADAEARRSWHAYHLIGDVMRSEELAAAPARDAVFLQALRTRLAAEPVVIAPADAGLLLKGGAAPARRQRWLVPMAAAAGFVAVAGVLVVVRMTQADAPSGWATLAAASSPGVTLVSSGGARSATPPPAGGGLVIRDARLDEFLRAHQSARGGMAVAAPGGALRRVEPVGNPVAER